MTRTRTAGEYLAEIRDKHVKEHGSWHWQAWSHENETRDQFRKFSGVNEGLLDKLILAWLKARIARSDNQIIVAPLCQTPKNPELDYSNSELRLSCAICKTVPVTSASSIIPIVPADPYEREKLKDYQNVTFVFFICEEHEEMASERLLDEIDNKRIHQYLIWIGRQHQFQHENE